jgi:nicotinate-nucleotide adenylyltransferase
MLGGEARLFFVIGADSFEEINTWREPALLLSSADLVVVTRPGSSVSYLHLPARFAANVIDLRGETGPAAAGAGGERRIYLADYVNLDVSSTEIRRRAREGEEIGGLVPAGVAAYIEKYGLYRR